MQIVLMRHGKPDIDTDLWVNALEFGAWVEKYNAAGIDNACEAPRHAVEQARRCAFVVCSNLARSLESARVIGVERVAVCSPMFREMEMPFAAWKFPRLSPSAWSIFFRLAWLLGHATGAESFRAAKARARSCAEQLADSAATHGNVLFVGHGSLNWFIARHLRRMGWSCATRPPAKHWECSVYSIRAR